MRVPVNWADADEKQWTPGVSVKPPSSPVSDTFVKSHACSAAALYAVVRSVLACAATAVAASIVPRVTIPGGNPIMALLGETPTLPRIVVAPVLVTVDPARTPKLAACPKVIGSAIALDIPDVNNIRVRMESFARILE